MVIDRGEESVDVSVCDDDGGNEVNIASANHDEHGWAGMDLVEEMANGFAKALHLEVREGGVR